MQPFNSLHNKSTPHHHLLLYCVTIPYTGQPNVLDTTIWLLYLDDKVDPIDISTFTLIHYYLHLFNDTHQYSLHYLDTIISLPTIYIYIYIYICKDSSILLQKWYQSYVEILQQLSSKLIHSTPFPHNLSLNIMLLYDHLQHI